MKRSNSILPFVCALALLTLARGASAEPGGRVVVERDSSLTTAGWITMGGGAALLAGSATTFALLAHERSEAAFGPRAESQADRNRAMERYQISGQVLLFTGAAAFVTGLSLVLFGPKEYRTQVAVGPGTLQLRTRF